MGLHVNHPPPSNVLIDNVTESHRTLSLLLHYHAGIQCTLSLALTIVLWRCPFLWAVKWGESLRMQVGVPKLILRWWLECRTRVHVELVGVPYSSPC